MFIIRIFLYKLLIVFRKINNSYFKNIFVILIFFAWLSNTGCATNALWEIKLPLIRKNDKISATSNALYLSSKINQGNVPNFLFKYKINKDNINQNITFPPYPEGYVLFEEKNYSWQLYHNLNVLLKEPVDSMITSITAKIISETRPRQKNDNKIRIDVNLKSPFNPITYGFKYNSPSYLFHTKKITQTNRENIEDIGYFQLGRDSARSINLNFFSNSDIIIDKEKWLTLAENPDTYNINIIFIRDIEEIEYYKSKTTRILLTPFAVLIDAVSWPIQGLYFICNPHLCIPVP
ncbi:Uncharacterized protein dnl_59200 [Desulfonema limicola]|uniref:Uncharacterized protein n=1 Tax=Desulfonema limicola TaxID=45656 RepID=A0A975BDW0_9BACT|nr:hypothetical protein [Desulfonema limicola]QTA83508.1 Uncharacterized protein dnl_59200 [Desulfonema limicola]